MKGAISASSSSSSGWEKTKSVFQVERAFLLFLFLFSVIFLCIFVYLSSQHILKVTPLVWGENPQEQVIVNTFAMFI